MKSRQSEKKVSGSNEPFRYNYIRRLTNSIYGQLTLMEDTKTQALVVFKVSSHDVLTPYSPRRGYEDPEHEIQVYQQIGDHPHLLKLYSHHQLLETHIVAVLEYIPGGDLLQWLTNPARYQTAWIPILFRQLVTAVFYCHQRNYAHMDLSLENVLVHLDQPYLKVCDFGLALPITRDAIYGTERYVTYGARHGKTNYVAPEVFIGDKGYPSAADVYSLGVILWVLYTHQFPYTKPTTQNEAFMLFTTGSFHSLLRRRGLPVTQIPATVQDLLRQMVYSDPVHRIGCPEILKHRFLSDVPVTHER